MVHSTNNEQGYAFLAHNTTWVPIDYEGITLMRKPLAQNEAVGDLPFLQRGFSKAAKYEKMKRFTNNRGAADYVILDVGAAESDDRNDKIITIGLVRIKGGEVERKFQCLVQSDVTIPGNIAKLVGITKETVEGQCLEGETAFNRIREFIGDDLVVGYNVQSHVDFLQGFAKRLGKTVVFKKVRDVMRIAHRKLDDLEDYELETVAGFFSLDVCKGYDVLAECMLIHKIYLELNEL